MFGMASDSMTNSYASAVTVELTGFAAVMLLWVFMFFQIGSWIFSIVSSISYSQLYKQIKMDSKEMRNFT